MPHAAAAPCAAVQSQREVRSTLKHDPLPNCREMPGTASDAIDVELELTQFRIGKNQWVKKAGFHGGPRYTLRLKWPETKHVATSCRGSTGGIPRMAQHCGEDLLKLRRLQLPQQRAGTQESGNGTSRAAHYCPDPQQTITASRQLAASHARAVWI